MTLPDLAGLVGVVLIAAAYVALQAGRIDLLAPAFSAINAAGAALVLVSLAFEFNLAAALIEGFWFATSLWGFARSISRRQAAHVSPRDQQATP